MARVPVVAITAADAPLTDALAGVFRRTGWEPNLLGFVDPMAGIRQLHGLKGRVDAWVYVPPSSGKVESNSIVSYDPVSILENGAQAAREIMQSQSGGGAIVIYISLGAVTGGVESPRVASMHGALLSMAHAFGIAWAQDSVRVNVILAPLGLAFERVHPTRFPLRRLATPEEAAWPAVFLASPESSYVTAAALRVDGGFLSNHYF